MNLWDSVFLGVVQGGTEFLPVSSSGHLVIFQYLLEVDVPGIHFEVAVHVATLLSVVFGARARLGGLVTGARRRDAPSLR